MKSVRTVYEVERIHVPESPSGMFCVWRPSDQSLVTTMQKLLDNYAPKKVAHDLKLRTMMVTQSHGEGDLFFDLVDMRASVG